MALNKEFEKYRQDFQKLCYDSVLPILKKEEQERKKILRALIIYDLIAAVVLYVIYYDFSTGAVEYRTSISILLGFLGQVEFFLGFAAASFIIFAPIILKNRFALNLKKKCMKDILNVFGNIKWYDGKQGVSNHCLKSSELFPEFSQRNTYDSFKGTYNGVDFDVNEIHLFKEYGGSSKGFIISTFKGIVIKFDINKNFKGKTLILSKNDFMTKRRFRGVYLVCAYFVLCFFLSLKAQPNMIGFASAWLIMAAVIFIIDWLYRRLTKNIHSADLKEIKLEDVNFSKKYTAFSTDQIEGRYLITTAFIDRFRNLRTAFGTNKIKCSFNGGSLVFAISTWKNLFEIGSLFKNLENSKHLNKFFDELISMYLMIDYFKLDEKTGL